MSSLTALRPYLLRAHYDWLMDNDLTPHLVVDATVEGTQVPQQYVKDGQIVLNIAETAVGNLALGNDWIEFHARFGGVPQQVWVPLAAVMAIYARENGAGVAFEHEDVYDEPFDWESITASEPATTKPVIGLATQRQDSPSSQGNQSQDAQREMSHSATPEKKRSHLSVVK